MNFLNSILSEPIFNSLSITLLHFLWQGSLIALGLLLFLRLVDSRHSNLRYFGSLFAMVLNLVAPIVTFLIVYRPELATKASPAIIGDQQAGFAEISFVQPSSSDAFLANWIEFIPLLSIVWMTGVIYFSIRLLIDMVRVYTLPRYGIVNTPKPIQKMFDRLYQQARIKRFTRLVISMKAEVPMVVGWFKPVILVPLSMSSGLTSTQLEMLLSHELAHIKRYDYLVNLLQTLVEVVLFFHPCVKWVSTQIRVEREYCCDDIAIGQCGNPLAYATALTEAELLRGKNIPQLAMAATGGDLKKRIFRAVGHQSCSPQHASQWLVSVLSFALIASIFTAGHVMGITNANSPLEVQALTLLEQNEQDKPLHSSATLAPSSLSAIDKTSTVDSSVPLTPTNSSNETIELAIEKIPQEKPLEKTLASETKTLASEDLPQQKASQKAKPNEASIVVPAAESNAVNPEQTNGLEGSEDKTLDDAMGEIEKISLPPAPIRTAIPQTKPSSVITNKEATNAINLEDNEESTKVIKTASLDLKPLEESYKPKRQLPVMTVNMVPYYPSNANKKRLAGEIRVKYTVTEEGRVDDIEFLQDTHRSFKRSIRKAMKKWRYNPGTIDGKVAAMSMRTVFDFTEPTGEASEKSITGTRIKR